MLDTGSIPVEGTKFAFTGKIEAMRIFQREPASVHIFPAIFLTASVALGLPLTAGAQDTSIGIAPNATTTKTTADPTQLVKASPFRFELEVDAPEKIKVFLFLGFCYKCRTTCATCWEHRVILVLSSR